MTGAPRRRRGRVAVAVAVVAMAVVAAACGVNETSEPLDQASASEQLDELADEIQAFLRDQD